MVPRRHGRIGHGFIDSKVIYKWPPCLDRVQTTDKTTGLSNHYLGAVSKYSHTSHMIHLFALWLFYVTSTQKNFVYVKLDKAVCFGQLNSIKALLVINDFRMTCTERSIPFICHSRATPTADATHIWDYGRAVPPDLFVPISSICRVHIARVDPVTSLH